MPRRKKIDEITSLIDDLKSDYLKDYKAYKKRLQRAWAVFVLIEQAALARIEQAMEQARQDPRTMNSATQLRLYRTLSTEIRETWLIQEQIRSKMLEIGMPVPPPPKIEVENPEKTLKANRAAEILLVEMARRAAQSKNG
jgi:hypothetical protein